MWVTASDRLSQNVCQVTTPVSTHLLFEGDVAGLVDTSIATMHEYLAEGITGYLVSIDKLRYLFITHSHFDHIGGIPFLRKLNSNIEVVAAPSTAEKLADKNHLKDCYEKNVACAEASGEEVTLDFKQWSAGMTVDRVVGDSDSVSLGDGVEVKLIVCPGHTEDSAAFYIPGDAALACGEALGCYCGRDKLAPAFMDSYKNYIASIDKLSVLETKIIGLSHTGALTGDLAQKFLTSSRVEAARFASSISERIKQGEVVEEIVESLLPELDSQKLAPDGPFVSSQHECITAMVQAVAENR